jgi:hypothetical protein
MARRGTAWHASGMIHRQIRQISRGGTTMSAESIDELLAEVDRITGNHNEIVIAAE